MSHTAPFWDRRRAALRAEAEAEAAAREAAAEAAQQQAQAEKTDDEILTELGLPDPDTLAKGDDFAAFMAKAVPEHIRKRALRKLWRSNPVLACVDGLNDYDDDYLSGSVGNAPVQTSYQVGRGLLAHVLEVAQSGDVAEDAPATLDTEAAFADAETPRDAAEDANDASGTVAPPAPPEVDIGRPRRMVFYFDGNSA
ncbi:DUF3306 domain-containing protein [Roseovarius dicentrarchi]|uniref:DUF3306 domain-containing protein n=1 Tax=Roseovarius dicentrarchi TaxID=2250573 RepID=UPI000DE897D5|nr:DUF3306 domain-containing protein [Roseovarius dicentrarchi]